MTEITQLHRRALDATGQVVAGINAGQYDLPTPDADWDVKALLNHIVAGNLWAAELAAGRTIQQVGDRLDGDVVGSDPARAYDRSAAAAAAAFEAPGVMDAPCAVSYGPVPGSVYAGHRFLDVLIHGWDLAKATGQETDARPGPCGRLHAGCRAASGGVQGGRRTRSRPGRRAGSQRADQAARDARPARLTQRLAAPSGGASVYDLSSTISRSWKTGGVSVISAKVLAMAWVSGSSEFTIADS